MKNTENQFRRFTYFMETDSKEAAQVFLKFDVAALNNSGVLKVAGYRKENQYFYVVDTIPKMDDTALKCVFNAVHGRLFSNRNTRDKNHNLPFQTVPLERIYELEQKKVYTPQEGQLKTGSGKCKRFVWTLLLEEDAGLMAEYRKAHSIGRAWPQITKNMKEVGVKDMEIYLHGTQAILIMDTKPDFDLEKVGPVWQNLPRENEWQEYVAKFQRTKPGSSIQEKWLDMEEIEFEN